jgi:hypothetical protein
LFLIVISILSFSNYISGLGFYEDDWYLLAIMNLSPDQSVAGVFTAIASTDKAVRPVYFFVWAISYKLFGLNPLAYQLLSGIFFLLGLYCYILLLSHCVNRAPYLFLLASFICFCPTIQVTISGSRRVLRQISL